MTGESLRLVLIAFALLTLIAAVILSITDHGSAEAWSAFTASLGLLVGLHIEKPTRPLTAGLR